MADIEKLLSSMAYKEARGNIESWEKLLDTGSSEEALRVREEKAVYFRKMREGNPELYKALSIEDKGLSETILFKLTGHKAVLD